jgi:tetratricopeptide (TPR) repeat protein
MKQGSVGSTIQFVDVSPFHSDQIRDEDGARRFQASTRAHFLLYGRVRVRDVDHKAHHFIELDGIVAHKLVSDAVRKRLAAEFTELLPRRVSFSTENDLLAFTFTSEWTELVAKYIIGIAAEVSGDLGYAERLFQDVAQRLGADRREFPIFEKLRQRIPIRLFEIYEARASYAYEVWESTHDSTQVKLMGELLPRIDYDRFKRPSVLFLSAIQRFLEDRDIAGALQSLQKCEKQDRNSIWHLNSAFLHAYKGDLKTAIRHYRHAVNLPLPPETLAKIEEFVEYIARTEPQKHQLYYCLGFYNWKIKGDLEQAASDFRRFLAAGSANQFSKERELAETWLSDIETELTHTATA